MRARPTPDRSLRSFPSGTRLGPARPVANGYSAIQLSKGCDYWVSRVIVAIREFAAGGAFRLARITGRLPG